MRHKCSTLLDAGDGSEAAIALPRIACAGPRLDQAAHSSHQPKGPVMLWTVAVVLLLLWGLGFLTSYTLGGFIHILLVLAVVAVLVRIIQGRKVLP
jgi:hypothetical protein